jgi:hypothetical protein
MSVRAGCLAVFAVLLATLVVGCKVYQHGWYQSLLPPGVDAAVIEYRKAKVDGLGPGGNEAGLLVYRMSPGTAQALKAGGVSYLDARAGEGRWYGWRSTPVVMDARWTRRGEHNCGREPGIGGYLGDFRCQVDRKVIEEVNLMITAPGSYYAYSPGGRVMILAPAQRKVIVAYIG